LSRSVGLWKKGGGALLSRGAEQNVRGPVGRRRCLAVAANAWRHFYFDPIHARQGESKSSCPPRDAVTFMNRPVFNVNWAWNSLACGSVAAGMAAGLRDGRLRLCTRRAVVARVSESSFHVTTTTGRRPRGGGLGDDWETYLQDRMVSVPDPESVAPPRPPNSGTVVAVQEGRNARAAAQRFWLGNESHGRLRWST